MNRLLVAPLAVLFCAATGANLDAHAQSAARQDAGLIRKAAEQFLITQATGLPGEVSVDVGQVDSRLNLAECPSPQAFLPAGSRAWGKTTVGVRCTAPSPWTVYVAATVRVNGSYVAASLPLAQGQVIQPSDVTMMKGDLAALPPGTVTELSQAIGRTALMSMAVGAPVRQDAMRGQPAVQQGQTVRLVSSGPGFKVSVEGRALTSAADGQIAQARTPAGQTVSGIARVGGVMEVAH